MRAYVIVATKGRAPEVSLLLRELANQTRPPDRVVIVGTTEADLPSEELNALGTGRIITLVADHPGAARQRNVGIERLVEADDITTDAASFVAFLDDDFRPAADWLEGASATFAARPDALAFSGMLLLNEQGTSEERAASIIAADAETRRNAPLEPPLDGEGLYGCNMVVLSSVLGEIRFDDGLPLYSWLEDADLSIKIKRRGKIVYAPACRGVHLNAVGGRTSGVRFGYSQIANPVYLTRQGTMPAVVTLKLVTQALAANLLHIVRPREGTDHAGRLRGNVKALWDMLRGLDRPDRILQLER